LLKYDSEKLIKKGCDGKCLTCQTSSV